VLIRRVLAAGLVTVGLFGCSGTDSGAGGPAASQPAGSSPAPTRPSAVADPGRTEVRHFAIRYSLLDHAAPATVTARVPTGWHDHRLDGTGSPEFTIDGADKFLTPAIVAYPPGYGTGADQKAWVESVIKLQYTEGAGPTRTGLSHGRIWAQRRERSGDLRVCLFAPGPHGVIVGVAQISTDQLGRLPEIKAVFESISVA
jgi:hypothetical protein